MEEPTPVPALLRKMIDEQGGPHPRQVCTACAQAAGADRASVAVIFDQVRQTVCASDPVASHIDELQFTMGEGPCIEACRTGRPVVIADLRYQVHGPDGPGRRWPMFTAALTEYLQYGAVPVRAIIALPLRVPASAFRRELIFGAVDLHYGRPLTTGAPELADRAQAAADAAALAVLGHLPQGSPRSSTWWHDQANLRTEVHQATGVIMNSLHLPADQALLRLHASAFTRGQTVHDRSQQILTRHPLTENDL